MLFIAQLCSFNDAYPVDSGLEQEHFMNHVLKRHSPNGREAETNARDAGTNAREAKTNARDLGANAREAEANARGLGPNAREADANARDPGTNAREAETNAREPERDPTGAAAARQPRPASPDHEKRMKEKENHHG